MGLSQCWVWGATLLPACCGRSSGPACLAARGTPAVKRWHRVPLTLRSRAPPASSSSSRCPDPSAALGEPECSPGDTTGPTAHVGPPLLQPWQHKSL